MKFTFYASLLMAFICSANTKPNFIFIMTDDHGWSQFSHIPHPTMKEAKSQYLETPNLTRLVEEGMRFTRGYSPASLCTPTRRSILCGASTARSGTEFKSSFIPHEHMTMPRAIKMADENYVCAHFGKWGEHMVSTPEQCGYDLSDGETGNVTGGMEDKFQPYHIMDDPKRTNSVTDRTIAFIKEQKSSGKPFYAQVSYYATHLSVELEEKSLKKFQGKGEPDRRYTAGFAGMLQETDRAIGRILDALDELEIADNTYVIFSSDNGGRGEIPGAATEGLDPNYPLTGYKHTLNEGGIRVPFYVRGPGVKPNSWSHEIVSSYDLLPSFYELAGGTEALPETVDGGSFVHLIHDKELDHVKRAVGGLVFHRPRQRESVYSKGKYKLLLNWNGESPGQAELYNTLSDATESKNLADQFPERVEDMKKKLVHFLKSVDAETVKDYPKMRAKKY
ncbi:N-acetylgalactosamine 6-sulfatase (GALNS) [Lentisphaera araneosa HTCC2155]|jgi:arylsulfatase A|uniref:N-acetylgalactosamine 6-sulfatase (GALNS) n=1 Tax=Lentisphaera araneosa HTCC2155 TaxID=313628 RepID=A6DMU3_9BACT|nr:sulfatase [Lentisphaera araneosa]EDM26979.1 N-acetylgalactosamine 6-sulfatase (GALNS) [Lentisphaera araneosa HTCC2155]